MSRWLRWLALAGGFPVALLARIAFGPGLKGLLVPSLVLQARAIAWCVLAGGALQWARLRPAALLSVSLAVGVLSAGLTLIWFRATWRLSGRSDEQMPTSLRPPWLVRLLEGIDRGLDVLASP